MFQLNFVIEFYHAKGKENFIVRVLAPQGATVLSVNASFDEACESIREFLKSQNETKDEKEIA